MVQNELAKCFLTASRDAGYSVLAVGHFFQSTVNEPLEQESPGIIYFGKIFFFDLLVQFRLRHIAIASRYPNLETWQDLQTLEYGNPNTIPMLMEAIEGYPKHQIKPICKLQI